MVDLELVGRHALLFDDDAMAAFVNSTDALVEWHSLQIDRYDVRHLLSSPPPPRKRRNLSSPSASSDETELDQERYLDLPPPAEQSDQLQDEGPKPDAAGSYTAVGFSYGSTDYQTDEKSDVGQGDSSFRPPFPVPDILLQSLFTDARSRDGYLRLPFKGTLFRLVSRPQPPTEKLHQIIARTAMFVSKHGGQSEIVLRVKQGDNPTFGFLMPDHNLHAYFRFLVDHQELLQSEADGKAETVTKDPNNANQTDSAGAGALSLLGSVYGNADDEDGPESKETVSEKAQGPSSPTVTQDSTDSEVHGKGNTKDDYVAKHPSPPKQKTQLLKRTSSTPLFKAGTSRAKKGDGVAQLSADTDKSKPSLPSETPKVENLVVEPPSDLKSLVERLVEFIMRNGKQFEEVLIEQDRTHGRFPFLLPSNIYHPYYLKVLQEAQQTLHSKKDDSVVVKKRDKKSAALKENEESGSCDMPPFDSDKKEKFKMVLGKYKKDGNDPNSSASQAHSGVTVDAAAAAAILQAATRGIRNPNFGIISSKLLNGDGGKSEQKGDEAIIPVPSTNEEDSSEAHLTKEQKLKADRLKRAKMFVAMLKSGSTTTESPFRSLSVEPQEHEKREGSVTRSDVSTISQRDKDDEFQERKSRRRSYRSRFGKEEEEEEEASEEERDHHMHTKKKHRSSSRKAREDEEDSDHHRKKHRSHRLSREEDDESKEEEDRDRHRHARKKHRSRRSSSDEEERDGRHSHKRRHSRRKHRSSRHGRKHDKSSDEEEEERRRRRRRYESDSSRQRKKSRAAEELEEGEISGKTSMEEESRASVVVSREVSVEGRASSLPSGTTEVSNDLRAKVRAMLMATR